MSALEASDRRESKNRFAPLTVSASVHLSLAGLVFVSLALTKANLYTVDVEVQVIENPVLAPQADIDLTKPQPAAPKPQPTVKKVFGATRDSLKSANDESGEDIKAGNTVATVPDNTKLRDDDASSLPIPLEEYLISTPPQLLETFKPQYPKAARDLGIEGAVRVEIVIDREGVVRSVRIIEGLGHGTEEAALEAARRLRFNPAAAGGRAVAVKIQFIINFELER